MNENVRAKWLTKLITTKLQITQINLILCEFVLCPDVVFNVNELSGLSPGKVLILSHRSTAICFGSPRFVYFPVNTFPHIMGNGVRHLFRLSLGCHLNIEHEFHFHLFCANLRVRWCRVNYILNGCHTSSTSKPRPERSVTQTSQWQKPDSEFPALWCRKLHLDRWRYGSVTRKTINKWIFVIAYRLIG